MSCLSFLTPSQRASLLAPRVRKSPEEVRAEHPAPPVTAGKLHRLRLMAASADPKIREAAAINIHTPAEVLSALAVDPEVGVRCCVARNEHTPDHVLAVLARDGSVGVRGWVAANKATSDAVARGLADDDDETVRRVVAWSQRW